MGRLPFEKELPSSVRVSSHARNQIEQEFTLNKQVDVMIDVSPAGAGEIKISTIVPDSLPWAGVYFDGVPVTITALPNPGYKFLEWETEQLPISQKSNLSITLNIDTSAIPPARFEALNYSVAVYPNPFSNILTFTFRLPKAGRASVKLYPVVGIEVAQLVSSGTSMKAGEYTFTVNPGEYGFARNLLYQVRSGETTGKL